MLPEAGFESVTGIPRRGRDKIKKFSIGQAAGINIPSCP